MKTITATILFSGISAIHLSGPNNFAQVYKDVSAKLANMDEASLAKLAAEKTEDAKKGEKKEATPEKDAEAKALEAALADRIYHGLTGPGYYGYWGGVYGYGYPGYLPAYHPSNYPTGEPMASTYPYYPMDTVSHITALKNYHDAVITAGIIGQAAPAADTVKKVLDIVTGEKKDEKASADAKK